jgi:cytochrome c oxidase assembly protein subunit 15
MQRALRPLLQLAFALALVVAGASVTLRLAGNGLGCAPWPACYGQPATHAAAQQVPLVRMLRGAHRIAASTFAVLALVLAVGGWRHWRGDRRVAGSALLVVTLLLAWVGLHTPSPLPLVTLINLLGGFALMALVAWLLAATHATHDAKKPVRSPWRAAAVVLLIALALQAAGGAMISARLAGAACVSGCDEAWLPGAALLWQPLLPGVARELLDHARAGQPLHWLHRLGAIALVVFAFGAALAVNGPARTAAMRSAWALFGVLALGIVVAAFDTPLWAAVAHALAAGLAMAWLAAALHMRGAAQQPQ